MALLLFPHSDIMESRFIHLISFSAASQLHADWSPSPRFFFSFWRAHGRLLRVGAMSHLVSSWTQKSYFMFVWLMSYATVSGLISWRGTSRQLEASYLWQLLSNCCFWTMTAPPNVSPIIITSLGYPDIFVGLREAPALSLWDRWWPVGDSDPINCTIMFF